MGPEGTTDKSVAVHQLKKEIRRTAKNISYDLERLDRIARANTRQPRPGSRQQQSGSGEQSFKKGSGSEQGPEDTGRQDEGDIRELSRQPGDKSGQKAGSNAGGAKPGAIPSAGETGGGGGGEEAQTGEDMMGGRTGGSRPGTILYSDEEENMDVTPGKTYDLRIRGDNTEAGEDRDVESAGTEVIERRDVFKKYAPTVGVDENAALSDEQAEDDAVRKVHIPVEYESIIKNIYTEEK